MSGTDRSSPRASLSLVGDLPSEAASWGVTRLLDPGGGSRKEKNEVTGAKHPCRRFVASCHDQGAHCRPLDPR